jgi:hypothetical protein
MHACMPSAATNGHTSKYPAFDVYDWIKKHLLSLDTAELKTLVSLYRASVSHNSNVLDLFGDGLESCGLGLGLAISCKIILKVDVHS